MSSTPYLAKSDLTGAVYIVHGKSKTNVTESVTALIKVNNEQLRNALTEAVQDIEDRASYARHLFHVQMADKRIWTTHL